MPDTITRNYAAEAVSILTGQSALLPERAHLEALATQLEWALSQNRFLVSVVIAVMLDVDQPQLVLPADLLAHAQTGGFTLAFDRAARGETALHVVTLSRRTTPQAQVS